MDRDYVAIQHPIRKNYQMSLYTNHETGNYVEVIHASYCVAVGVESMHEVL